MTRKRHIVIVDDEANIGRSLRLILEGEGYRVSVFDSTAAFLAERGRGLADVYLLDVRLPDGSGIDLLRQVRQWDERSASVMISGHATVADAVEATRIGAFDFLEKPLARDRVLLVVKNALAWSDLQRENQRYREMVGEAPRMIGSAPVFQHAVQQATQVARSDVTVLLSGESGTGKELLAAYLHRESPFAAGPFVKVNCAAIPTELIESELFGHEKGAFTGAVARKPGKFEMAHRGTLFLDEIGDLPLSLQAKILRALEERKFERVGGTALVSVDVRLVAATNRGLKAAVAARRFREDLFFRLSVFPITVPPLRERGSDIPLLARYFVDRFCRELKKTPLALSPAAVETLLTYRWPGNVRELQNCIERAVILADGDSILPRHLNLSFVEATPAPAPPSPWSLVDLTGSLNDVTKRAIAEVERLKERDVLREVEGNKGRAAESLQISYKSLLAKMKEYAIE
jgi:DNA-binding NtrC family response regulator